MNHPGLARLSPHVQSLDFTITFAERRLSAADCSPQFTEEAGGLTMVARHDDLEIRWRCVPDGLDWQVTLEVSSPHPLNGSALEWSLVYAPPAPLEQVRILTHDAGAEWDGMLAVPPEGTPAPTGTLVRGAFAGSRGPGLLMGVAGSQQFEHYFGVEQVAGGALRMSAQTRFPRGYRSASRLAAEPVWMSVQRTLDAAMQAYYARQPHRALPPPPVGWNSWDYYLQSVTLEDVIENMDAIRADPVLSRHLRYIVVDDGWEHLYGDWYPNFRFPGGLERLVAEIRSRGFVPGIWTTPALVGPQSTAALRSPEMLIKNEHGDPVVSMWGNYLLDPTHPRGEAHLRELYTRLYDTGFRFFKIDFASPIIGAPGFHDPAARPVEVLRNIYRLIRSCVGPDSHILGCSLPAYCGGGLADSQRISMDIRNRWSHIEWVADSLQLVSRHMDWMGVTDPDFLVVRGTDTSLDAETNLLNPKANDPQPSRWQRGPVFNRVEAQTWATLVALSGGSLFLGDRLTRLNETGWELIRRAVPPCGVAARPLDLGDAERASIWLQTLAGETRLGLINWSHMPRSFSIRLLDWGISAPESATEFWHNEPVLLRGGVLETSLPAHGSLYLRWPRL